jgi:hypothetical protein
MRVLAILLISALPFGLNAQNKYLGNWNNYWGCELSINEDSTFKFSWHFDLSGSWTAGTWKTENDTIFFKVVLVYDTLRYFDSKRNIQVDSTILSLDDKAEVIPNALPNFLSSGGQNIYPMSDKLFYRNNKLYVIDKNGELIKSKMRNSMYPKHKPLPRWYIKTKQ